MNFPSYEMDVLTDIELDKSCVPYLIPIIPSAESLVEYEQNFEPTLQKINDLLMEYAAESQVPYKINFAMKPKSTTKYEKPIQNFIVHKFCKIQKHLNQDKEKFYSEQATNLSVVSRFLLLNKKANSPLLFDVDGFKVCVAKKYYALKHIQKELHKIYCLDTYLQNADTNIHKRVNMDKMREILTESTQFIDTNQDYSPYSAFDSAFEDFLENTKTMQRFDISVKTIVNNLDKKRIDMKDVSQVNNSFNMLFLPKNSKEKLVMHFAIVRVLFNEISLVPNFFLFSDEGSEPFFSKAAILRKKTAKELLIADSLLKPEMIDLPFEDIVKESKYLKEGSIMLNCLHFLTNPYDIVYETFKVLKKIDQFVVENKRAVTGDQKATSMMSFDDVFSIFCPLMAIDPPKNCVAMSSFMDNVVGLQFSTGLDFAKLVFSSSVRYIINLEL